MTTNFPAALDSYTTKVDNVDSVMASHVNNPQDAIVALETQSVYRYIAELKMLPGLVGLWPMSSISANSGQAYDIGGQVRHLSKNGNPQYRIINPTTYSIPIIDLDGTGDYLNRADESGLDILGSESWNATPGLSAFTWVAFDNATPGSAEWLLSKDAGAGQRSWRLTHSTAGKLLLTVSADGTAIFTTTSGTGTGTGWVFAGVRFVPSTSIEVYIGVGGAVEKTSNTTSIPAALFNSNADLTVGGGSGGSSLMAGRVGPIVLAANAWSDEVFTRLYNNGRILFGV